MLSRVTAPSESLDTRTRILHEASKFFSARGYYGASTRDIAAAVGIKQPSLFHHFDSKREMFQELLDLGLVDSVKYAEYWRDLDARPGACLYRFLYEDFSFMMRAEHDQRGPFSDDALLISEFPKSAEDRRRLHQAITEMIRRGVEAGEFVDLDVDFARHVVTAQMLELIRQRSAGDSLSDERPARVAWFITRALLRDSESIDVIVEEAMALPQWPGWSDSTDQR